MSAVQITVAAWRALKARQAEGERSREYQEALLELDLVHQKAGQAERRARRIVKFALKTVRG